MCSSQSHNSRHDSPAAGESEAIRGEGGDVRGREVRSVLVHDVPWIDDAIIVWDDIERRMCAPW